MYSAIAISLKLSCNESKWISDPFGKFEFLNFFASQAIENFEGNRYFFETGLG
jgi:hypothetical protein